jgi:hypothetical protein
VDDRQSVDKFWGKSVYDRCAAIAAYRLCHSTAAVLFGLLLLACQRDDQATGLWVVDAEKMRPAIHDSLLAASLNVTAEGVASMSEDLRAVEEAMLGIVSETVLQVDKSLMTLSLGHNRIECRRLGQQAGRITVECGKATQELRFDGTTLIWSLDVESASEQKFAYVFKRAMNDQEGKRISQF